MLKGRKAKTKLSIFFAIIAVLLLVSIILMAIIIPRTIKQNAVIEIYNDDDFLKYQFPGYGNRTDPYRIENLIINHEQLNGIIIHGTTSSFVIRNCSITVRRNPIDIEYTTKG